MGICIPVFSWMAKTNAKLFTLLITNVWIGVSDTTQIIIGCIVSTILVYILAKVAGKGGALILIILGFVGIPAGGVGIFLIVIGILLIVVGASPELAALLNALSYLLYLLCYGF